MAKFGIGQPVRRSEDPRLLTGRGRYTDDVRLPGQAFACFVRSPFAHARIVAVDTAAASDAPGVIGIVTGDDLAEDGIGTLPVQVRIKSRDGAAMPQPPRPALAQGRVRHVGDPVALVVAETPDAARDAAELVEVDYDPLPAAVDLRTALDPDAPEIWEQAPGNRVFDWELGDEAACNAAFTAAAHVVSLDLVNNRLAATPMEGRACLAAYDADDDRLTLHVSSQGVHGLRDQLADDIFHLPADRILVVTGDVGGGFGMKIFMYPEYISTLYAARKFGRPVAWAAERTESFISDDHGRDNLTKAELAVDADGRFLALRADTLANLGAYLSNFGPFIPTNAGNRMLCGLYAIPVVYSRVRGVFTNTQPIDAYRGAGRPEAAYVVERLVDVAARQLGIDPVDLRKRNYIPPEAMPYKTATGLVYDSGDFARNLDDAVAAADLAGAPARKATARAAGKLCGIGISTYVEACASGAPETAVVRVDRDGHVTVLIGTQTNGQGHETAYKQIIAEHLGVDSDAITIVQGDSDRIATGGGTGGSRSIPVGGASLADAALKVQAKARIAAADVMEAAPADVTFEDGRFRIVGTDRSVTLAEIAVHSDAATAFDETADFQPTASTFPNGAHICEIEVDLDTGRPQIVRYTVVDDVGRVMNPLLVEGQVHGGIAQSIGQALFEEAVFDTESGQLLTGSLMDYALPRADSIPFIDFRFNEIPCRTNPLGIKGAGEAGTIGACPAVINALVDALAEFGVRHVDMPARAETLWRLIRDGGHAAAA
ncbi:MAG: xanthine dehydrogenase family protein molybdopterin-binding subunit [Rhodospirillaceae bacterium]|nr:xanthine dehydrogenase family protein molybdopterin-binding subunit [Rhodospirillaceae bacterium]